MRENNIESGNYVGYVWYSNADKPEPINGIFGEDLSVKNPFIIEGQLYDENRMVSYTIKFVDGEYVINRYEVLPEDLKNKNKDKDIDTVEKCYYSHRIDGSKKLYFLEYWRADKDGDELCENMKVLQPAEVVFVGYKSLKNKED